MTASRRLLAVAALALLAALLLVLRSPGTPTDEQPAPSVTATPAPVTETVGFTAREGLDPSATAVNDEPAGDLNAIWATGDIPAADARRVRDEFIRGVLHDGGTERRLHVYLPSTGGAETFECARYLDVVRCDGPGMQVFIA